jgi:hypothetical protein
MNRRRVLWLAVAVGWAGNLAGAAALPFPQHVEYAPVSLLPTLRSRAQLDQDVLAAYTVWQTNYLAQAGTEADGHPRYRVKTSTRATAATVSEGQGYGMLLTAYLAGADPNAQTIFDGLQANFSPGTGLIPDFAVPVSATNHAVKPAPAHFREGANDGHYSYNAGRVPWRIGTDALLNNNALSATQAHTITTWTAAATGGDPRQRHAGYQLNGTPLAGSDYYATFFVAPMGVGAMSCRNLQPWLNAVYSNVYGVSQGYYEDSVGLLCLLVMSGNYWDPTTTVPEPAAGLAVLLAAAGVAVARRSQHEKAHRAPGCKSGLGATISIK